MKIAFVVHDYHRHGGHARYVAELASRFKQKHEVHVYSSVWEEPNPEGIRFHRIPSIRWTALTSIISFFIPASFIPTGKFDIVHSQGFCGMRQNIVTAHISNRSWYSAAEKFGGQLPLKKKINKLIVTALERFTFRPPSAKVFIAVSDKIRRDLQELHSIPQEQIEVIRHGVDLNIFSPEQKRLHRSETREKLGLDEHELVFLYVGDWQKAGPPLITAMEKLECGKLLVVTKTKPTIIYDCMKNHQLGNRLVLCSPTREIQKIYAGADVFVFPSYYDSFGMVVTEAMASGLPVITNYSVGASELMTDGVNGILMEKDKPWDSVALANAMSRFVKDPELSRKMGKAAKMAVEGQTWDICAEKTLDIYRRVLEQKNKNMSKPSADCRGRMWN